MTAITALSPVILFPGSRRPVALEAPPSPTYTPQTAPASEAAPVERLPVIYSQRDPRWAELLLGIAGQSTIGGYGCYLTCFAMMACAYGHPETPLTLNQRFIAAHAYVQGNLLTDSTLTQVYPDVRYQGSLNYYGTAADLGLLRDWLAVPGQLAVLELDFDHDPSDGIQTHFVVAADCDGSRVTIADTWYGTVDDLTEHYGPDPGAVIYKYVLYRGPVVAGR